MKRMGMRLLMITMGVGCMAIGTHCFLVPHALAAGGVTGISVVVNYLFPSIPVSLAMLVGNVLLFIVGWLTMGRQFGLLTFYATFMYSAFMGVAEAFFSLKTPLTNDVLLSLIFGCTLMGIGLALVFQQNASTGGTDILSKILNLYFHVDLAKAVFLVDVAVVAICAWSISFEKSMYAAIGIYLQSSIIDQVIAGSGRRIIVTIISSELEEINRYIQEELNRGTTLYEARGGFSGTPRTVLLTVVRRAEYIRIREFAGQVDSKAFVYMGHVNEVLGEGFTYELGKSPLPDSTFPKEES